MASGKRYRLDESKLTDKKLGPQPLLIVRAMMDAGRALTVKEIADMIKSRLVTRQEPERVVNFYMSTWKKKGLVYESQGVPDETPVSETISAEDVGTLDIADLAPEEQPHEDTPSFDWAGASLKQCVLQVLREHRDPQTAMDIHQHLQVAGKSGLKVKSVADAISKLARENAVRKDPEGRVLLPDHVHA